MWRWVMLFFFSVVAFYNGLTIVTLSSIPDEAEDYYNMSSAWIGFYTQISFILYIPLAPFSSWLLTKNLYRCILALYVLTVMSSWIKWLAGHSYWISFIGQTIVSMISPLLLSTVSVLALVWFPPNEQLLAISLGELFAFAGMGVGILIAPMVSIHQNMLIQSIIGSVFTLLFIVFGKKDPIKLENLAMKDFFRTVWTLCKDCSYLNLNIIAGSITGIILSFFVIIGILLEDIGISNTNAGVIGFCMAISGILGGLCASFLEYKGLSVAGSSIFFLAGSFVSLFVWAFTYEFLAAGYVIGIFLGFFLFGLSPLTLKYVVKLKPDINPSISSGMAFFFSQISGFVFSFALEYAEYAKINCLWGTIIILAILGGLFLLMIKRNKRENESVLMEDYGDSG